MAIKAAALAAADVKPCPAANESTGLTLVGVLRPGSNCQSNPNGEPPLGNSPVVMLKYSCKMNVRSIAGLVHVGDMDLSRLSIEPFLTNVHKYTVEVIPGDLSKPSKLSTETSIAMAVSRPPESESAREINRDWCEAPAFNVWAKLY